MPAKLRVSFSKNRGAKRGQVCAAALVDATREAMIKACVGKLSIAKKHHGSVRLFLAKASNGHTIGTELPAGDLTGYLGQDAVLCVSTGEAFYLQAERATTAKAAALPKPPRWPWPEPQTQPRAWQPDAAPHPERATPEPTTAPAPVNPTPTPNPAACRCEMNGPFPVLEGRVLEAIRLAIRGCPAFVERGGEDYVAFDYKSATGVGLDVFPDPAACRPGSREQWNAAVRRECRGLLVHPQLGTVLARRLHKFFNLNELPETHVGSLKLHEGPLVVTDKVDGSLVSPHATRGGPLRWATKSVRIPEVERFVAAAQPHPHPQPHRYGALAEHWVAKGWTPLFEWCTDERVVGVIQHAAKALTLLALRHCVSGDYLPRPDLEATAAEFNVPLVARIAIPATPGASPSPSSADLVARLSDVLEARGQVEGAVVSYAGGRQMLKLKTLWYTSLARASKAGAGAHTDVLVEALARRPVLRDIPARNVWQAVLSAKADDIVAKCASLLLAAPSPGPEAPAHPAGEAACLQLFAEDVRGGLAVLNAEFLAWGRAVRAKEAELGGAKALLREATALGQQAGWGTALLHAAQRGDADLLETELLNRCRRLAQASGPTFPALSHLIGASWAHHRRPCSTDPAAALRPLLDFGPFAQFTDGWLRPARLAAIQEHVLDTYLPRKVRSYLGLGREQLSDATPICIPRRHRGDEGKIRGLWEQFEDDGMVDLRIDLQPPRATGHTPHFGDEDYANLLVQFGPNRYSKVSSRARPGRDKAGSLGGVLVATGTEFPFAALREALALSFATGDFVCLEPRTRQSPIAAAETGSAHPGQRGPLRVFCDLDGVLADFEGGYERLAGRATDAGSKDAMWRRIKGCPRFFRDLELMPDAPQLWRFLRTAFPGEGQVTILTGLPQGKLGKVAAQQKVQWCRQHLGPDIPVITCMRSDKFRHSHPDALLIDDHSFVKRKWTEAGGAFVLHESAAATVDLVAQLIARREQAAGDGEAEDGTAGGGTGRARPVFAVPPQLLALVTGASNVGRLVSALATTAVLGLDVEWQPDEALGGNQRSAAQLVQLAVDDGTAFVVDCQALAPEARDAIAACLQRASCLKLVFDGNADDFVRLAYHVPFAAASTTAAAGPILDLQRLFMLSTALDARPSLALVCRELLGQTLRKSKQVQAGNWSRRPLSQEQLRYAACDAAVLPLLHAQLLAAPGEPAPLTFTVPAPDRSVVARLVMTMASSGTEDAGAARAMEVEFVGVFLDGDSKQRLAEAVPAVHPVHHIDHVTLAHRPDTPTALRFNVGRCLDFQAVAVAEDARGQAVIVEFVPPDAVATHDDRVPHVTISTGRDTAPAYSNTVLATCSAEQRRRLDPPIQLRGTVGAALVPAPPNLLLGLPAKLQQRMAAFVQSADPGAALKFQARELSASERSAIHQYADATGLLSRSEGKGAKRRLVLQTAKHRTKATADRPRGELQLSFDAQRVIAILDAAGPVEPGVPETRGPGTASALHGRVGSGPSVEWCLDAPLSPAVSAVADILRAERPEPTVVVVRGLPGSGKSALTELITREWPEGAAAGWSADEFFYRGAGTLSRRATKGMTPAEVYAECFSVQRLPEAHRWCLEQVGEAMDAELPLVVVDNTHTTRKEYAALEQLAASRGYRCLVVELVPGSSASRLRAHSLHNVPGDAFARMVARWEPDPRAVRLESFHTRAQQQQPVAVAGALDMSLHQWLTQHHCFHFSKKRPHTHLRMAVHSAPASFVYVPDHLLDEFHRRYAAEPEPQYLMEFATSPRHRLFMDLDFEGACPVPLADVASALARAIDGYATEADGHILIAGLDATDGQGAGYHLHAPVLVTPDEARHICDALVKALAGSGVWDEGAWAESVDREVYLPNRGLRMLQSRKPSNKGQDLGRVYAFKGAFSLSGGPDAAETARLEADTPRLLRLLSIRAAPGPGVGMGGGRGDNSGGEC